MRTRRRLVVAHHEQSRASSWRSRSGSEQRKGVEVATFVFIHGAGDVGWYWHLLEAELRERGHDTVCPDLPCDDDSAGLPEYADTVVDAIGDRSNLIVVAPMIPAAGEAPADYWAHTR